MFKVLPQSPQHNFTLSRLFLNEPPNLILRTFPPVLQLDRNRLRLQTAGAACRLRLNKRLFLRPKTELRSEITLLVKLLPRGNEFIPLFFRNIPELVKFLPFFLRQTVHQHVTGFLRLELRNLTPVLHPERQRLRRFLTGTTRQLFLMKAFFPIRQFKHFPAAVKSVVRLAFFNVITPRFLKHLPQCFPLQNTRRFTLLFRILHILPRSRLRRFRNNFRFLEQPCYFPHNLTDQPDRRLFRFEACILIEKTFPMLSHMPDRRSIIQHRFDLPQRCFRPFHNVLVTEIRQRFRFLFPHRLRKRQYRIRRNLPIADQIMNACPFPCPFGKTPPQMSLVRTVKRHLFTPATERHIECFSIQRFRRYHYVFRSPPL